jgi:hypothetical protein
MLLMVKIFIVPTVETHAKYNCYVDSKDLLCGLVVGVPGYRSRGPGSIPSATRSSEKKWVWNGVHSAS